MIFEMFDKIQPSDCKVNQASWSAGYLEGSVNMNLTCKISKKFHIPKQTPSTEGSSRQSHSRCSVHTDIYSSSLQSSLSKLFVAGSDLALRVIRLLWPLGGICHPNASPAVCFGRYWWNDQWRSIFWTMIKTTLHNSTKKVQHKNPPRWKRTELDKNGLFWWHDFFAQQLGAVLPTQLRQNRRGEAGLAPCMDTACFVSSPWWVAFRMAKVHTYTLLADEENQKPPGCSRTIDKMNHEVKGSNGNSWITPNGMIPAHGPLPIIYVGRGRQHW